MPHQRSEDQLLYRILSVEVACKMPPSEDGHISRCQLLELPEEVLTRIIQHVLGGMKWVTYRGRSYVPSILQKRQRMRQLQQCSIRFIDSITLPHCVAVDFPLEVPSHVCERLSEPRGTVFPGGADERLQSTYDKCARSMDRIESSTTLDWRMDHVESSKAKVPDMARENTECMKQTSWPAEYRRNFSPVEQVALASMMHSRKPNFKRMLKQYLPFLLDSKSIRQMGWDRLAKPGCFRPDHHRIPLNASTSEESMSEAIDVHALLNLKSSLALSNETHEANDAVQVVNSAVGTAAVKRDLANEDEEWWKLSHPYKIYPQGKYNRTLEFLIDPATTTTELDEKPSIGSDPSHDPPNPDCHLWWNDCLHFYRDADLLWLEQRYITDYFMLPSGEKFDRNRDRERKRQRRLKVVHD